MTQGKKLFPNTNLIFFSILFQKKFLESCPKGPSSDVIKCVGEGQNDLKSFKEMLKNILVVRPPQSEGLKKVTNFIKKTLTGLNAGKRILSLFDFPKFKEFYSEE